MTINLRDRGLKNAFVGMLNDSKVSKAEVEKLIESAGDGKGLSKTERKDLEKLLGQVGDKFDADAKVALETFLGIAPGPGGGGTPEVAVTSKYAATLTKIEDVVASFSKEIKERATEFTKPEDAFPCSPNTAEN
jgi:hypothetical protein